MGVSGVDSAVDYGDAHGFGGHARFTGEHPLTACAAR